MMGKVSFASEIFNCSAPDTGNMEVLDKFGSDFQNKMVTTPFRWRNQISFCYDRAQRGLF